MRQHEGRLGTGGGDHRGSIFRLLIGAALQRRGICPPIVSWGVKGDAAKAAAHLGMTKEHLLAAELPVEQAVTAHIQSMQFLLLPVDDEAGPASDRGIIERGAISLLTSKHAVAADPASATWLGRHSDRPTVQTSGLWNNQHVFAAYDGGFLDAMERWVDHDAPLSRAASCPATVGNIRPAAAPADQTPGNAMRLKDKTAVIIGAGQSPGETTGNGRATAIRFAQEGARVLCVDRDLASADETATLAGNGSAAFQADVLKEDSLSAAIAEAVRLWGRLDILHYNVGVSIAGGDAPPTEITAEAFDRVTAINLRGFVLAVKHALPVMRRQEGGVILSISSAAAVESYPYVAYKTTKAAMLAFTEQVAIQNAEYGIRCNTILPGLMDTPMAVDTRVRHTGKTRAEVAAERNAKVPLRRRMGTAWDVANAALFLASDEAGFITGVALPVDGGRLVQIG
jgi:NAD(P)-dependent dehydrogenase (short-subunit alcohol dehydrogenase family)